MKKRIYTEEELPCYLSAEEISAYLGLGLTATYELLHDPDCPKIIRGRRIIVPRDKFLQWLDQITEGGR
jgi:excisionase family DNA binding protein